LTNTLLFRDGLLVLGLDSTIDFFPPERKLRPLGTSAGKFCTVFATFSAARLSSEITPVESGKALAVWLEVPLISSCLLEFEVLGKDGGFTLGVQTFETFDVDARSS
jgi:hypothetical protein